MAYRTGSICISFFFNLSGTGKVKEAAWTLPTSAININATPAAAGIGGLAVRFATDMEMSWQGLAGGAIAPNDTWFQLLPGIIGLTATQASNVIANQQFDLWENETDAFDSCALALSNALLTVTKPVSYYLAGKLKNRSTVESGNLVLLHGLYYFLPTLPDPYAANLAAFLRHQQTTKFNINDHIGGFRQIIALLLCTVGWPDTNELNAEVSYQFFPVLFGKIKNMGFQCGRTARSADVTPRADETSEAFTLRALAVKEQDHYNPAAYENPWEKYLSIFGPECYSLLDVSTNADLMGISYGVYNRDVVLRMTHQAVDAGSQAPVPYQIEGMDPAAPISPPPSTITTPASRPLRRRRSRTSVRTHSIPAW